jgi:hypothetical protein
MDNALEGLVTSIRRTSPDLTDEWEATALVESFGMSDDRVRALFGFPHTRALGRHIYQRSRTALDRTTPVHESAAGRAVRIGRSISTFSSAYSQTFVYAVPWMVMFAIEGAWPDAFATQPEMAGPISVAVMASLITSGGFVQAIARKGSFYLGMQQPALVRRMGLFLCRLGMVTTLMCAVAGVFVGFYVGVFGAAGLAVAAFYYVMLSALWLACAMLSVPARRWRVPVVYLGAALVFLSAKFNFGLTILVAQPLAVVTAVLLAAALTAATFPVRGGTDSSRARDLTMPRTPVLLQALLPHFVYGVAYFMFLFADRLSAGSALPAFSGLQFGLAPDYKHGIDLAFLVFLLVVGIVEHCNDVFMRYWRKEGTRERLEDITTLGARLARRRTISRYSIVTLFVITAGIAGVIAVDMGFLTTSARWVFAAGCLGYVLFTIGLFDALMLFSIDRPSRVLRALLPALLANVVLGYILSHAAAAQYAVLGLVLGATLFAIDARRGVNQALQRADYAYARA